MLVGYFSPYGNNNPIAPVGFFMGQLIGVKTPPMGFKLQPD
jgi:hypothetical protein